MIAVDTNILVYAHRVDSLWHEGAKQVVYELATSPSPWGIPWPCIHEFLAISTHPRIFAPPTPLARALDQVEAWFESPSLVVIGESPAYWDAFRELAVAGKLAGPVMHDGRVAALCRDNGVHELWSADRDFGRFPSLTVRNPLVTRR